MEHYVAQADEPTNASSALNCGFSWNQASQSAHKLKWGVIDVISQTRLMLYSRLPEVFPKTMASFPAIVQMMLRLWMWSLTDLVLVCKTGC